MRNPDWLSILVHRSSREHMRAMGLVDGGWGFKREWGMRMSCEDVELGGLSKETYSEMGKIGGRK